VENAVDLAARELIALASPGQGLICLPCFLSPFVNPDICQIKYGLPTMAVSQVQLDRAKESTKSAVLMNLESRVCSLSLSLLQLVVSMMWNFFHLILPHHWN